MRKPDPESVRKWGQLSTIGPLLVASVLVGYLLGNALDSWLGWTKPWGLVVCVLLGTAGGFIELVRLLKDVNAGAAPKRRRSRGGTGDDHQQGNRP